MQWHGSKTVQIVMAIYTTNNSCRAQNLLLQSSVAVTGWNSCIPLRSRWTRDGQWRLPRDIWIRTFAADLLSVAQVNRLSFSRRVRHALVFPPLCRRPPETTKPWNPMPRCLATEVTLPLTDTVPKNESTPHGQIRAAIGWAVSLWFSVWSRCVDRNRSIHRENSLDSYSLLTIVVNSSTTADGFAFYVRNNVACYNLIAYIYTVGDKNTPIFFVTTSTLLDRFW